MVVIRKTHFRLVILLMKQLNGFIIQDAHSGFIVNVLESLSKRLICGNAFVALNDLVKYLVKLLFDVKYLVKLLFDFMLYE